MALPQVSKEQKLTFAKSLKAMKDIDLADLFLNMQSLVAQAQMALAYSAGLMNAFNTLGDYPLMPDKHKSASEKKQNGPYG